MTEEELAVLGVALIVPAEAESLFLVDINEEGDTTCVLQYLPENSVKNVPLTFVSVQTEGSFKNKGYLSKMLDYFFEKVVAQNEVKKLRVTSYSLEGELFLKPALEKRCAKSNVEIIEDDKLSPIELIKLYSKKGC